MDHPWALLSQLVVSLLLCYTPTGRSQQSTDGSSLFLLCDFSGGDLCNWRPQGEGDIARWIAFSHTLNPELADEQLPESRVESFAYIDRQATASYEDRQATLTTTKLWPASTAACLKFQLWLTQAGDEVSVIKLNDNGEKRVIFQRNESTVGNWVTVQREIETVGPYQLIFNGTTAERLVKTRHTVAITKIQVFPFTCQTAESQAESLRASKVQVRTSLNTMNQAYAGGLWVNNRIPYFILHDNTQTKSFSRQEYVKVQAAIEDLNLKLPKCIQFVQIAFNATPDFLYIIHDTSRECWSDGVGRIGGIQAVRLNSQCLDKRGAIQSILLNAVGLYHEHDRADRDKYLKVNPENIVYWAQQYFMLPPVNSSQVQFPSPNAAVTWGLPYDPTSLTHFSERQYSFDGARRTLELLNPPGNRDEVIGQREGLSIQDINKIYLLYGCNFQDRVLPNVTCYNGGTPAGYYFCLCPPINATATFSGLRCETPLCARRCGKGGFSSNPCVVGDNPGDPNKCFCNSGYTGEFCESYICSPACANEGTCTGPNICTCRDGYSGGRCEYTTCNLPCRHGGTCLANDVCACPYGFRGPQCQFPTCNAPCQNGGTCIGLDLCDCVPPYEGPYCETNRTLERIDCLTNATLATFTTSTTTAGYSLVTPPAWADTYGWSIDPYCPYDGMQFCAKYPGCADMLPQGACLCKRGFVMVNGTCKQRVFLGDYCDQKYHICHGDAECIDFICQCNPNKGLVPRYSSAVSAFYSFCIKAIRTLGTSVECLHPTHCKPPMICVDSTCKCPYDWQYFDPVAQTCILHGQLNGPCEYQPGQCKALGTNGGCVGGVCGCQSGTPIPYWYNGTEVARGKLRYMCGDKSMIEYTLGGACSTNPFKFGSVRVCNLTLLCVTCPYDKTERCALNVNVNIPKGILGASFVEPTPLLLLISVISMVCIYYDFNASAWNQPQKTEVASKQQNASSCSCIRAGIGGNVMNSGDNSEVDAITTTKNKHNHMTSPSSSANKNNQLCPLT